MQMQLRMGCASVWGQGQHLPHGGARLHQGRAGNFAKKRHIDTIVLGMQMQLRMGCATGWGKALGMRNDIGAGQN